MCPNFYEMMMIIEGISYSAKLNVDDWIEGPSIQNSKEDKWLLEAQGQIQIERDLNT